MCFARTSIQYYAGGVFLAMGGMGPPTLQSALTKHVAKEEVGRLLGALSLLGSLSRGLSPTVLNLLYSFTVKSCPQTVFIVLAGFMFTAFVVSWGVKAHGIICYGDLLLMTSESRPRESRINILVSLLLASGWISGFAFIYKGIN
jgi:hypothetical protein